MILIGLCHIEEDMFPNRRSRITRMPQERPLSRPTCQSAAGRSLVLSHPVQPSGLLACHLDDPRGVGGRKVQAPQILELFPPTTHLIFAIGPQLPISHSKPKHKEIT